jgi:ABC-type transport system involved in multi-copper enzyme maturation permease subunit
MPALLRYLLRFGPLNPIALRLVQGGSRRARHMYIRSVYLGAMILALLWLLLLGSESGAADYRALAAAGANSFAIIAYLQIGLICVLAPVFMAGAIAQEASPRTWEVLLTTPLSPGQIVMGNLGGRLFFILALLLCSLPLFALTQYFGGVPGRSILASYLIAACAATLVGSIAIALSCSRVVGRRAVFAFYVTVVSYLALTIGIDRWLVNAGLGAGPAGRGVTPMTALNPFLALNAMLQPTNYPRADAADPTLPAVARFMLGTPVRAWCLGSLVLSAVMVLASIVTVRAGGLATIARGRSAVPLHRRIFGLGAKGEQHRAPRQVWSNPVAWREAAARNSTAGRILARWSFILLGGLWGVGLVVAYHRGGMTADSYRLALATTVLGELAITALVAINMSATAISREREDGTLDLLLTTPLTAGAYLNGKLRGLVAYLLPLIMVPVGTVGVAGLAAGLGDALEWKTATVIESLGNAGIQTPVVLPEALPMAAAVSVAFIAFCVMIGLQWSLKSKGTLASVVGAVGVVALIAGTMGLCGFLAGSDVPVVGPALAALTPASAVRAMVDPRAGFIGTLANGDTLLAARVAFAIGTVLTAGIYTGAVYAVHTQMVRTFDFTVRKLAGTK